MKNKKSKNIVSEVLKNDNNRLHTLTRGAIKVHNEHIECPECESEQLATVEHTFPWWSYVHTCTKCNYIIMESEWNKIQTLLLNKKKL